MNPLVSVIVPVYNVEKYLNKCIDSIISQKYQNIEIILVDDGSPDNCGIICDKYAQNDARIKVRHKKNEGVSVARNNGIDMAKGDYIMFVDSDDWIEEDMISSLLRLADSENDLIASSFIMEFADATQKVCLPDKTYTKLELMKEYCRNYYELSCLRGPYCKLYKRDILRNNNIRFKEYMFWGEDTFFNVEYINHCQRIVTVSDIYYHYIRFNENSVTSKVSSKFDDRIYGQLNSVFMCELEVAQLSGCTNEDIDCMKKRYMSDLIYYTMDAVRVSRKTSYNFMSEISEDIIFKNNIQLLEYSSKGYIIARLILQKKYRLAHFVVALYLRLKK